MILTKQESKSYKALYRHWLRKLGSREDAHEAAWREARGRIIMRIGKGEWTEQTRADVLTEIAEIEGSVRR